MKFSYLSLIEMENSLASIAVSIGLATIVLVAVVYAWSCCDSRKQTKKRKDEDPLTERLTSYDVATQSEEKYEQYERRAARSVPIWIFRWFQHILRAFVRHLLQLMYREFRTSRSFVGPLVQSTSSIYRFLKPYIGPLIPVIVKIIQISRYYVVERLFSLRKDEDPLTERLTSYDVATQSEEKYEQYELEQDRVDSVRGLQNLGNTCYFSSTMQALVHTNSVFPEELKNLHKKGEVVLNVLEFFSAMQHENAKPYSPNHLHRMFGKKSPKFADYRQHDSHECLRNFLDNVRKEERDKSGAADKRKVLTVVDSVFGGHFMTVYICKECETPYHACETFLDISLPIMIDEKDLAAMNSSRDSNREKSRTVKLQTPKSQTKHYASQSDDPTERKLNKSPVDKSIAGEDSIKPEASKTEQDSRLNVTLRETRPTSDQAFQFKSKTETTDRHSTNINAQPLTSVYEVDVSVTSNEPEQSSEEQQHKQREKQHHDRQHSHQSDLGQEQRKTEEKKYEQHCQSVVRDQNRHDIQEEHGQNFRNSELDEKHEKALGKHDGKHLLNLQPENQHKSAEEQQGEKYNCNRELKGKLREEQREQQVDEQKQQDDDDDEDEEEEEEEEEEYASETKDRYRETVDKLMTPLFFSSPYLPSDGKAIKKHVTIYDCLMYFTREEHIHNEYLCNPCYAKHLENGGEDVLLTSATKQTLIFNPPAILTLHLKRFELKPGASVKRTDMITYGELLDIAPYCSSMCLRNDPSCQNICYSLYGVVVHHGSTFLSGHHIAYVKIKDNNAGLKKFLQEKYFDRDLTREQLIEMMQEKQPGETHRQPDETHRQPGGTWYCMNDSWSHEVSVAEVLNQEAYLLFYERMS